MYRADARQRPTRCAAEKPGVAAVKRESLKRRRVTRHFLSFFPHKGAKSEPTFRLTYLKLFVTKGSPGLEGTRARAQGHEGKRDSGEKKEEEEEKK